MEALMTLLWATRVFEKQSNNEQWVGTGRQEERELDQLFTRRDFGRGFSLVSREGDAGRQKSLEGWRS